MARVLKLANFLDFSFFSWTALPVDENATESILCDSVGNLETWTHFFLRGQAI